jgi:hypothetical protein
MSGEQWGQLFGFLGSLGTFLAAVGAYLKARTTEKKIDTTEKKIDENTAETKNGHAVKEKMLEETAYWRTRALKLEVKADRADSLESAMQILPEGRAFRAALERQYGWRNLETTNHEQ